MSAPRILIVEDSLSTASMVEAALRGGLPEEVEIIHAASIQAAHAEAEAEPFDFFILDIHLPDGTGLDFLCDIRLTHPDAGALVMTAVPLPAYREYAGRAGVVDFLAKPVDGNRLVAILLEQFPELSEQAQPEEPPNPSPQTTGRLRDLGFADVIQIKCLSGVNALLEFVGPSGESGVVGIQKGKVIHAAVDLVEGREAFLELAAWGSTRFIEKPLPPRMPQSISEDWSRLLRDSAKR